jgi:hypothetical protein
LQLASSKREVLIWNGDQGDENVVWLHAERRDHQAINCRRDLALVFEGAVGADSTVMIIVSVDIQEGRVKEQLILAMLADHDEAVPFGDAEPCTATG